MGVQTYFLGSNSAYGFYSCYQDFCKPENGNFLWVIKGGPGCGKSSFMRKIGEAAEKKGLDVEYVICSGDPNSLDGVYIPQIGLGYVDGTAPHLIDVPYPGAFGMYLDLGQFYNASALRKKAEEIKRLNKEYKESYAKSYALLSGVQKTLTSSAIPQNCKTRFHSAISCIGIVSLPSLPSSQTISVSDMNLYLNNAASTDIIYLHPLWPDVVMSIYSDKDKKLYCSDISIPECQNAVKYLQKAKTLHDELEKIYNPYVNFDGVYNLAAEHTKKYL